MRQEITTTGSASTATQAKGVQVNLYIQQRDLDRHAPAAEPDPSRPTQVHPGAIAPIHNLVHRDRAFTGREEQLASLRQRLVSGGAAVVQAVHGMGGVGKTQLALEYAHRHLSEYDVVWWVLAEQAGLIGDQFTDLGVALGIVDTAADSTLAKSKVLEHLSGQGRWLLIFDNAVQREDVLPWLPRDAGHVLITSRSANWNQVAQAVELDVMARHEAVRFLLDQQPGLDSGEARLLAEALGDLPLALTQAAGYLAETGMSGADYRRALADETQTVLELGQPVNYPQSLGAAITMSLTALSQEDPAAVAILRLCAFLAPEPIPVDLIAEVASPTGPYPEALRAAQETVGKTLPRQEHIGRIGAYGLARVGRGTVTVHRLTQAAVRSQMEPSEAAGLAAHLDAALGTMNPGDPRDAKRWPAWARLLPHLLAVQPDRSADTGLRECARDAVVYLVSRGDAGPARQLAENLHTGWRDLLGPNDRDTLRAATERVWALRDLGQLGQLQPLVEDTLTRLIDTYGYNDPDTLRSAADLAVVYSTLGNNERAEQIERDVLERSRRLLGEDHPDTLRAEGNLAGSVVALGRYQEGQALERDVLERSRRLFGEDHPNTLRAAGAISSTMQLLGRYEEALALKRDVLERSRRLLGEDHPDTLTAAGALAGSVESLGRYEEALVLARDVLERRRRLLGEDHPDTLTAAGAVASTMQLLDRHEGALALAQDVLERRRRQVGEDHPDTLTAVSAVASTMRSLGRHEAALALARDVFERRRRQQGEDHPHTLTAAGNLASAMWSRGPSDEALALERDVLERRRRLLGEDHPDTLHAALNLGISLFNLRRLIDARRLIDRAWQDMRDKFGDEHPNTRRAAEARQAVTRAMGGRTRASKRRRR